MSKRKVGTTDTFINNYFSPIKKNDGPHGEDGATPAAAEAQGSSTKKRFNAEDAPTPKRSRRSSMQTTPSFLQYFNSKIHFFIR